MLLVGRNWEVAYRFGFGGDEIDRSISETNNLIEFEARIFDPRIGRWFSPDDYSKKYPHSSPYNGLGNSPILFAEEDGNDIILYYMDGEKRVDFLKIETALELEFEITEEIITPELIAFAKTLGVENLSLQTLFGTETRTFVMPVPNVDNKPTSASDLFGNYQGDGKMISISASAAVVIGALFSFDIVDINTGNDQGTCFYFTVGLGLGASSPDATLASGKIDYKEENPYNGMLYHLNRDVFTGWSFSHNYSAGFSWSTTKSYGISDPACFWRCDEPVVYEVNLDSAPSVGSLFNKKNKTKKPIVTDAVPDAGYMRTGNYTIYLGSE
jgi:RHS repeat-associated protein